MSSYQCTSFLTYAYYTKVKGPLFTVPYDLNNVRVVELAKYLYFEVPYDFLLKLISEYLYSLSIRDNYIVYKEE